VERINTGAEQHIEMSKFLIRLKLNGIRLISINKNKNFKTKFSSFLLLLLLGTHKRDCSIDSFINTHLT
jgi:hypothetical protein